MRRIRLRSEASSAELVACIKTTASLCQRRFLKQNAPSSAIRGACIVGGTEKGSYVELLRQQTALARFGEMSLRSDDLGEILTEACRLAGVALGTDLAKVV